MHIYSMTFLEWLRHTKYQPTRQVIPEADRLLLVIQGAGSISRHDLGRSIDLPFRLVDELLNSLARSGMVVMNIVNGQVMIRCR